jgi:RNA polymerase sigma-70 factor (ECF subfamily)
VRPGHRAGARLAAPASRRAGGRRDCRLRHHPQLGEWPQLHIAHADLLRRLARTADAIDAYRTALRSALSAAEHAFVTSRIEQLDDSRPERA